MPIDNQFPQFGPDIKKIIISWKPTIINQRNVYIIFHSFHKSREWLSATIDKWLNHWHMYLLMDTISTKENNAKLYKDARGGFGTVARRAKAQTIRKYMNYIMQAQQWSISTTKSSSSRSRYDYLPFTYGMYDNYKPDHVHYDRTKFYYVTKKKQ